MGTDDALVFTTGHQANVGTLGTILAPGDTVVADSGDHASILDGCLLSRAKLRPFRHNRIDKLERALERAAGDGGGVLVVVDGVFSMEGDIAPSRRGRDAVRALRRAADGRRGARRRRAGRARRRRQRAARGRGPRRPAHGHVLQVARGLRRLRRRPGRRHRLPARPVARLPLHRLGRARGRRRDARGAADRALGRGPRRCWARCSTTRASCATGSSALGFAVVAAAAPSRGLADDRARRRRRHRRHADRAACSSATTGRPCCSGARSTTPGSSSTPRCIPRSRPAARCCARASWRPTTARRSIARSRRSRP